MSEQSITLSLEQELLTKRAILEAFAVPSHAKTTVTRRADAPHSLARPLTEKLLNAIHDGQLAGASRDELEEVIHWLIPQIEHLERNLDMNYRRVDHTVRKVETTQVELVKTTKSLKVARDEKVRGDLARNEKRSAQAVARKALLVALLEKRYKSEQDSPTPEEIADIFWSEGEDANPESGLVKFVKGARSRWGADVFKKDRAELRKNGGDPFS